MGSEFYLQDLSEGKIVRHHRLSMGWRQIALASLAHREPSDIKAVEKDRWVRPDIHPRVYLSCPGILGR
jgi:hypothetical protein